MANVLQKPYGQPDGQDDDGLGTPAHDYPFEHIDVKPITPHTGAEIRGVTLANASQAQLHEIDIAFAQHLVLVFRQQELTQAEQKAFGRRFGNLHIHPSFSHLGKQGDPELFIIDTKQTSRYSNGEAWHSDVSCDPIPPLASLLYIKAPPIDGGGDTLFANMYEAFRALSKPLQTTLLGLTAVHDGQKDLDAYNFQLAPGQSYPRAEHPVVIKHPQTNRAVLYVNGSFTSHINGLNRSESDALLELLYQHIEQNPRWQLRVRWSPNTLVMWDNRCTQHHAVWDYYPHARYAERVTVQCPGPPQPFASTAS